MSGPSQPLSVYSARQWPLYPSESSTKARGTGTDTSAVLRFTGTVSAIWSEPLAAPNQLPPNAHWQWLTSPCSETWEYPNQPYSYGLYTFSSSMASPPQWKTVFVQEKVEWAFGEGWSTCWDSKCKSIRASGSF